MTYGARSIKTIDLNNNAYIGFGFPFNVQGIFRQTALTKESTKANLINFFLTNPGERYMNPEFGGGLRAFIFEQLQKGNIDGLRTNITSQLTEFFPNVTIRKLDLQPDYDRNKLYIELTYMLAGTGEKDRVFINL